MNFLLEASVSSMLNTSCSLTLTFLWIVAAFYLNYNPLLETQSEPTYSMGHYPTNAEQKSSEQRSKFACIHWSLIGLMAYCCCFVLCPCRYSFPKEILNS